MSKNIISLHYEKESPGIKIIKTPQNIYELLIENSNTAKIYFSESQLNDIRSEIEEKSI